MKKIVCFLLTLCMLFCFGCAYVQPTEEVQETITITDHSGKQVTLPKEINRIVVCDVLPLPSVLTVFFDSAQKLVGISPSSMAAAQNGLLSQLYPEILQAETGFINGSDVNMEELMKLKPDVVFYLTSNAQLGEKLENAGIPAVAIATGKWGFDCVETMKQWIALLSEIFPEKNRVDAYEKYSHEMQTMVQERVAQIGENEKRRALFLFQYNDSTIVTSGKKFWGQWWAEAIGTVNVSEELADGNSVAVNMEQIYQWNPDLIFITNFNAAQPEDLYKNTIGVYDWSGVQAVQNQQAYKMPLGMYRTATPSADTPVTLLWLAQTAYPEVFADIDIVQEAIDYYQEVFDITLTQEQAESIFKPSSAAGAIGR